MRQQLEELQEKEKKELDMEGKLSECPDCFQRTQRKEYTSFGVLSCLSSWWICGLGVLLLCCLREKRCHNCDEEIFKDKARELRLTKVFVDNFSVLEDMEAKTEAKKHSKQTKTKK